jgi:hypothetical protein
MHIVASLRHGTGFAQPLHLGKDVAVGGTVVKIARHAQPRLAFRPADRPWRRRQNILLRAPLPLARHDSERAEETGARIAAASAVAPAPPLPAALPQRESVAITALLQNLLGLEPLGIDGGR